MGNSRLIMSEQLPLFLTEAEQRDVTLLANGYPNYVPKTDVGRMYAQRITTTQHTPVCRHLPNKSININS